ncbi:hypothetical protein ACHWQZ_G015957 [Mnemiopsis leidyi]
MFAYSSTQSCVPLATLGSLRKYRTSTNSTVSSRHVGTRVTDHRTPSEGELPEGLPIRPHQTEDDHQEYQYDDN